MYKKYSNLSQLPLKPLNSTWGVSLVQNLQFVYAVKLLQNRNIQNGFWFSILQN